MDIKSILHTFVSEVFNLNLITMTYAEVVYMILDELKLSSDDSYFNEYHVLMLADKYRAMILKQRYKDIRKQVPYSNYQEVMFTLNKRIDGNNYFIDLRNAGANNNTSYIQGAPLETNYYFSGDGTKEIINDVETENGEKILKRGFPMLINIGNPSVYLDDYNHTMINLVSREHGRYVGNNKYLRNVLYAFIEPNKGLYVKIPDGFKMKLNPANREAEVVEEGTINNPKRLLNNQGTDKYSFPSYINASCSVSTLNPDEGDFEKDKYYILPLDTGYNYTVLVKCIDTVVNGLWLEIINKRSNDLRKFDNTIVDDGEGNETVVVANNIPIKMAAVFEDSVYASEFTVEKTLHPLDRTFPMEDSLVNLVIEAVVKELTYPVYRKEDTENNGTDTMPENQAVAPNNRR